MQSWKEYGTLLSNIKCDTGPTHPLGRHFSYPRLFADFDLRRFAQSLSSSSVGRCAVSHFLHETESDLFIVAAAVAEPQIVLYVLGQSNVRRSLVGASAHAQELGNGKRIGHAEKSCRARLFLCKRPRPKSSNGEGEGCGKCQGAIQSTAQDVRIEEAFPNRGLPRRGGASHGRTNERRHWVRSLHTSLLFVRAMFSRFDDSSQCKNMTKYSSDEVRYISFYKCYSRQNSATIIFASYNSVKLMRQNQVIQFRGRVNKWRDRGGGRRAPIISDVSDVV